MQLKYVVEELVKMLGTDKIQVLDVSETGTGATLKILPPPDVNLEAYICLITKVSEDVYEVVIPSFYGVFTKTEDVPQWLAVSLLKANTKKCSGFWCIYESNLVGEPTIYSICQMWNISMVDFTTTTLSKIIASLVTEVSLLDTFARENADKNTENPTTPKGQNPKLN